MFYFLLPFRMNYETQKFPIVTITLIGINTVIYLIGLICFFATGGDSEDWIVQNLWLVPSQMHWWMWLTHMFMHAGILHLGFNMIFLFLFGCCVEDMVGRLRFCLMYLAGGVIATLIFIDTCPVDALVRAHMCGASGAISACMGMYLLLRANASIEFKYIFISFLLVLFFRAGEFEVPAWFGIVGWFVPDVYGMIMAIVLHTYSGVAHGAHVGGLLAGCAMIWTYKKFTPKQPEEVPVSRFESLRAVYQPAMAAAQQVEETATIYIAQDGQQTGPYTVSQVRDMLQAGSIGDGALFWAEGMADWQDINQFVG